MKSKLKNFIDAIVISTTMAYSIMSPLATLAIEPETNAKFCRAKTQYEVVKTIKMMVTAYSSTIDQTDNTPFITASGKTVEDGIIANNMFPFGTRIRIPSLYGEKVFVVEDRMHSRKGRYHADIWFENYREAKIFGAKITEIEVLES